MSLACSSSVHHSVLHTCILLSAQLFRGKDEADPGSSATHYFPFILSTMSLKQDPSMHFPFCEHFKTSALTTKHKDWTPSQACFVPPSGLPWRPKHPLASVTPNGSLTCLYSPACHHRLNRLEPRVHLATSTLAYSSPLEHAQWLPCQ